MKKTTAPLLVTRVGYAVAFAALVATGAACSITTTGSGVASSCTTTSSLSCAGGTQGYTCSGASQPEDTDPGLVCSTDGTGAFCCSASACNYDSSLACGSATGYSCTAGASPPDAADSSLVCSAATSGSSGDQYCCYTNATTAPAGATCTDDPSIVGCQANADGTPSYGFSCTGTENPDADFSNITCSTPTAGTNGNTTYCCIYN